MAKDVSSNIIQVVRIRSSIVSDRLEAYKLLAKADDYPMFGGPTDKGREEYRTKGMFLLKRCVKNESKLLSEVEKSYEPTLAELNRISENPEIAKRTKVLIEVVELMKEHEYAIRKRLELEETLIEKNLGLSEELQELLEKEVSLDNKLYRKLKAKNFELMAELFKKTGNALLGAGEGVIASFSGAGIAGIAGSSVIDVTNFINHAYKAQGPFTSDTTHSLTHAYLILGATLIIISTIAFAVHEFKKSEKKILTEQVEILKSLRKIKKM